MQPETVSDHRIRKGLLYRIVRYAAEGYYLLTSTDYGNDRQKQVGKIVFQPVFFVHILRIEIFDGGPPVSILDFSARQKL